MRPPAWFQQRGEETVGAKARDIQLDITGTGAGQQAITSAVAVITALSGALMAKDAEGVLEHRQCHCQSAASAQWGQSRRWAWCDLWKMLVLRPHSQTAAHPFPGRSSMVRTVSTGIDSTWRDTPKEFT